MRSSIQQAAPTHLRIAQEVAELLEKLLNDVVVEEKEVVEVEHWVGSRSA